MYPFPFNHNIEDFNEKVKSMINTEEIKTVQISEINIKFIPRKIFNMKHHSKCSEDKFPNEALGLGYMFEPTFLHENQKYKSSSNTGVKEDNVFYGYDFDDSISHDKSTKNQDPSTEHTQNKGPSTEHTQNKGPIHHYEGNWVITYDGKTQNWVGKELTYHDFYTLFSDGLVKV